MQEKIDPALAAPGLPTRLRRRNIAGMKWPSLSEARDGPAIAALHIYSQILGKAAVALLRWRDLAGTSPCGSIRAA